jgi:hypothetical protein
MLPTAAGSNTISQPTVVANSSADVTSTDDIISSPPKSTIISVSRYNNLLYIERNISSIINYKVQQILEKEEEIERRTSLIVPH